jgi:hypothetical protein
MAHGALGRELRCQDGDFDHSAVALAMDPVIDLGSHDGCQTTFSILKRV